MSSSGTPNVAVVAHMIENQPFGALFKEDFEAAVAASSQPLAYDIFDSHGSAAEQVGHVERALQRKVDALVLMAIDPESVKPVLRRCRDAGIPVILVNNEIDEPGLCRTTILPDNRLFGRTLGEFFVEASGGRAEIVEVRGIETAPPSRLRSEGFREAIAGHPGMRIVGSFSAGWLYERAREGLARWLPDHPEVDCVLAQNDEMARAAWDVANELGRGEELLISGVDAIKGQGLSMVLQGKLAATLMNPPAGRAVVASLLSILAGEPVLERNVLRTSLFRSNERIRAWQERRAAKGRS